MAEPNPMQAPADEKRFYRRLDPRRATLRLLVGLVIGVVGAAPALEVSPDRRFYPYLAMIR